MKNLPRHDLYNRALGYVPGGGGGGAISSVFGRTGDISAQPGDYTAEDVGAVPITATIVAGDNVTVTGNFADGNLTISASGGGGGGQSAPAGSVRLRFDFEGQDVFNQIVEGWTASAANGTISSGRQGGLEPLSNAVGEMRFVVQPGSASNFAAASLGRLRFGSKVRITARVAMESLPTPTNDVLPFIGFHYYGSPGYYGPNLCAVIAWQGFATDNWHAWTPQNTFVDLGIPAVAGEYAWVYVEHAPTYIAWGGGSTYNTMTERHRITSGMFTSIDSKEVQISIDRYEGAGDGVFGFRVDVFEMDVEVQR